jgi:type VI secretion system protein ImpC
MTESLIFEFNPGASRAPAASSLARPMRILVMGDFSGRANRAVQDGAGLASRPILRIDLDNFEGAPGRLSCALDLALDGPDAAPIRIDIRQFDDFHPDQVYRQPGLFAAISSLRAQLADPSSFDHAAAQLGAAAHQPAAPPASADTTDNPFAKLLGADMQRPARASGGPDSLASFIKGVVGPITVADPRHAQAGAALDASSGERMRALLHDPAFRGLEEAWRGLHLLITSLELDEQLQVHLLDVSKDELQADLQAAGVDLEASGLFRLLVGRPGQAPDGNPWSVLVGDYRFGNGAPDIAMLAAFGAIAAQAGAPFLAAASDPQGGSRSDDDGDDDPDGAARWMSLRHSEQACWIGLAMPDLLLRLPYGQKTDRIESFPFEEMKGQPAHHDYLWGNPGFGCALLLGRAFEQRGWDMAPGDALDIGDLPAHTWQRDGEAQLQACGGAWLSEREGAAILRNGVMPLLSIKDCNAVRLLRFQSIAEPVKPLSGPWPA